MAMAIFVNGPTLVTVNGSELGLSDSSIQITLSTDQQDVIVDAWGGVNDVQAMFSEASISMTLVHFDYSVLQTAILQSMGASAFGQLPVAGTLLGSNSKFMSLRMTSPTQSVPWTFPTAYLKDQPLVIGLGTEKSIATLKWRAIPTYDSSPYNNGQGTAGVVLWTNT